jgi:hypothetical protein
MSVNGKKMVRVLFLVNVWFYRHTFMFNALYGHCASTHEWTTDVEVINHPTNLFFHKSIIINHPVNLHYVQCTSRCDKPRAILIVGNFRVRLPLDIFINYFYPIIPLIFLVILMVLSCMITLLHEVRPEEVRFEWF